MTIQTVQNELIPGADRHIYYTTFSFVTPEDLRSCALVSRKCRALIKEFNADERLGRAFEFIGTVLVSPRNAFISNLLSTYSTLAKQRLLTDEEKEELRPWVRSPENAPADLQEELWQKQEAPKPLQLLAICQGPDEVDKRALLFDKTGQFLNAETRTCYRNLSGIACSLLQTMGPCPNEGYVSPVVRAKRAVEKSKNEKKFPQSDIEEAVWFLVSHLGRRDIADAEENCRTLVQIELAKLPPREVEKMGETLQETFTFFKELVEICQRTETRQSKAIREYQFATAADRADFIVPNGVNPQNLTTRFALRLIGGFFLALIICAGTVHAIPTDYPPSTIENVVVGAILLSSLAGGFFITLSDYLLFPSRAEIQQDENGAEVVRIIPHPLRGRAKLCCDLVSVGAIAFLCMVFFINN